MKPCIECGALTEGTRCAMHQRLANREHERAHPHHNPARDPQSIRMLHRRILRQWMQAHGPMCPGYLIPAHQSFDLTVDDIVPLAVGGDIRDASNKSVLCRRCNGRKAARGWGTTCAPTPALPTAASLAGGQTASNIRPPDA